MLLAPFCRRWMFAVMMVMALTLPSLASEETLTILFTNDTHNRLQAFDDVNLKQNVGGIVRRTRYFDMMRKHNPRTLILDAGDAFQGTPLYNVYKGEPDLKAMSLAGYDAMTIGNHDLDDGIVNLRKHAQYTHFPLLCANLADAATGNLIFRPFQIFNVHGMKVAVIGFMSEHAWQAVAQANREPLKFMDPVPIAQRLVQELRPKVDLIIGLHHMGLEHDQAFAKQVPGIDIIIGGHSHTRLDKAILEPNGTPNGLGGTLIHQAYYMGVYVGRLDITYDQVARKITRHHSELVLLDQRFDQEPVRQLVDTYANQLGAELNTVIGESQDVMSAEGKYNGPFALGSLIADMIRAHGQTDVGILNTGGVRTDLGKGPITVGKIFEILPFDNALITLELQGKVLAEIVKINASRLRKSKNLQFSNLVYTLNKEGKVTAIQVGGKPLDPERWYTITTIDYVFAGNEDLPFQGARNVKTTGVLVRDMMIEHIRKAKQISAPKDVRLLRP
jgi:5'-nucleotidase/UDP-sugar diphosphatase